MPRFPGSLVLLVAALLSAPMLHAQQPTPSATRARALTNLVAPAAAQAPFAVSAYTYEFLDPTQSPAAYLLFLSGTRTFSDGRVSEEITRVPDFEHGTLDLVNQSHTAFTYDATGRLASETQSSWIAGAWVPTYRTSYTRNGAGFVTVELEEEFASGAWQNDYRTTTTYVGGLPSQILSEDWKSGAWVVEDRTTISESGGMAVVVDEEWNGTAYVNSERTTYAASVQAIFNASNATEGSGIATGFFYFIVPDRALTAFTYALSYTTETWDTATSAWVNSERTRPTLDNATTLQAVSETWDDATSAWVITNRTTLTFAADQTQDILMESSADGTTFTPDTRIAYTYDASGNAALVEFFTDEEGDGTLDTPASSRVTLTYTDLATGTEKGDAPLAPASHLTSVQPTPTAGDTDIAFVVAEAGRVSVRVFDALGREVARLANQTMAAGPHTVTLDAAPLPGGVYVVRLEAGGTTSTRTLVVAH